MKRIRKGSVFFGTLILLLLGPAASAQTYKGAPRSRLLETSLASKDSLYGRVRYDLEFLQLSAGDTVADIGSYDGFYPAAYSVFTDSITFYLNDKTGKGFADHPQLVKGSETIKASPLTNRFILVTGTDTSSGLPFHTFDKVILRDALHHFTSKEKMLADIRKIMEPGARLFLYEILSAEVPQGTQVCKGAMNEDGLQQLMLANGFVCTRIRKILPHLAWMEYSMTAK